MLLKISGEALMGRQYGIDPPTVERIAKEIQTVHEYGPSDMYGNRWRKYISRTTR